MIKIFRNNAAWPICLLSFFTLIFVNQGLSQDALKVTSLGWTIGNNNGVAKGVVIVKNDSKDTIHIDQLKYNGRNVAKPFLNHLTLLPQMGLPVEWANSALEKVYRRDMERFCSDMKNEKFVEARFEVLYTQGGAQQRKKVSVLLNTNDLRNCPPDFYCCVKTKRGPDQFQSQSELIPLGTSVTIKNELVTELKGGFILLNRSGHGLKITSISDLKEQIRFKLWSPVGSEETVNNYYNRINPEQGVFISYKSSFSNEKLSFKSWKKRFKVVKVKVGFTNGSEEVEEIVTLNCSKGQLIKIIE